MRPPHIRCALLVALALGGAVLTAGCKVEPLQDPEELAVATPAWRLGSLPILAERGAEVDPTLQWETSVRKHLSFLTARDLAGRRPGSEGGRVTAAAAEALFEAADLIPSAGNFGWTTSVPVRVVRTKDAKLVFSDPTHPTGEQTIVDEGLWVHHRGAAGSFSLPLRPVELSLGAPPSGSLALSRLRDADPTAAATNPERRVRAVFDAAYHRGATACLLELPAAEEDALAAAHSWSDPEVQSVELDRDPPSGLALEGFVEATTFAALQRVSAVADAKVEVKFEAVERWFEDRTVVGRVVGGSRPEQVVIVTANWDAGGIGAPLPEGGAALSATGAAALFALVERVGLLLGTGRQPKRSIVFVAAAGGSLGNLGLARLADAGIAIPENIVAIIHLEDLDWTAPAQVVVGGTKSTLGGMFTAFLPSTELVDGDGTSGHEAFDMPSVPRVTLTRRGGTGAGELDASTPLVNLATSTRVAFDVIWELANSAQLPELVEVQAPAPAAAPTEASRPALLPAPVPPPAAPPT